MLDCDPGYDDALAIVLAGLSPCIDIQAITVVAGNQTIEKTTQNALNVCSKFEMLDIPIATGMSKPILRKQVTASGTHGESGLDGLSFEKIKTKLDSLHAVDLIIKKFMESNGYITLVAIGPLTNIAMAILMQPAIVSKIGKIVLMGGTCKMGNVTPSAEFNIFADPEAAHIVFNCGRPIVMVGLDLTHQVIATQKVISRIKSIKNEASKFFLDIIRNLSKNKREIKELGGPPLHDLAAIARVIDPSVMETKPANVAIEIKSEQSYGRTICDYFGVAKKPANAEVAIKLHVEKFWNLIYKTLKDSG
ncbi:MAG: nucleoside hydrolase [Actinomycetota bacterium]|nr:nucleoside hydrolase [Actinomycetota bacterium]